MVFASEKIREINISKPARALQFLRFTDYVMVLFCGFGVLGLLLQVVIDQKLRQEMGWIITSILFAVLSFSIYVGFRHVGVINPHVWRAYIIAFPMLLLVCIVFVLSSLIDLFIAFVNNSGKGHGDAKDIALLFLYFLGGVVVLSGFVSILLLRSMLIAPLGIALVEILSRLRNRDKRVISNTNVKRANVLIGSLYGICGGIIVLGGILPDDLRRHSDFLVISRYLFLPGFFFLVKARRYFQINADSLLSVDKRSPILFLRAFNDDERQIYKTSLRAILDFSLETRLANHFSYFGPFIALGSPRASVPGLGAAQVVLLESEWRSKIISWISEAVLIIMYAGKTPWVKWELTKVIDLDRVSNLILMIPEINEWRYADLSEETAARIKHLRDVFKSTRWNESLSELQGLQDICALLFSDDGAIVVIKSRPRNRDAYHLAALIAHYIILNPAAK
ncbi:MAG TPA: hypothetical protein VJ464_01905 [Blastocatellia bacterium]|nr:hypothetical protein [Blastocatellia bacterium]